ncbi:hypothetical protein [Pelotomaculum propionicicum]|uniref:Uncharacterized protein n=1 Tax=Pelotomaculum propionicicum TaxID=258475 RepID=A0A4Y7RLQ4_9FIRM|nr:hypothetical protein [Pelotomaculum propionicicum]NLI12312.1 hypothetical protein [Peptococcaceae bacterium]TEB09741.1 hypothetical protein Pmgp_02918 [Pelotomaculum propionicicum]
MKFFNWELRLGVYLVLLSFIIYLIKYFIISDLQNTYIFVLNALGFLPVNVLLVTVVLNKLLTVRAKRDRLEKTNMVIGMFFSEMGTHLLSFIAKKDPNLDSFKNELLISDRWSAQDYTRLRDRLKKYACNIEIDQTGLAELKHLLNGKRDFLLRLLENPALLEHESFTESLRSTLHVVDELDHRKGFADLPDSDLRHLAGDIKRAYRNMAVQWLAYMQYLNRNYPYLFSFALRTNPFDEAASPVVKE